VTVLPVAMHATWMTAAQASRVDGHLATPKRALH
jgi:hypothetical protein